MIILIRTDKPEAELYLYNQNKEIGRIKWQAHRELSDTLLSKIDQLLTASKIKKTDLNGIVVYQGPGSFTGLRIGITVANTMAYALKIPIVGSTGDTWESKGIESLDDTKIGNVIVPKYGSEAHITKQRK